MNVQPKDVQAETPDALEADMLAVGRAARGAAAQVREASPEQKNTALIAAAEAIRESAPQILDANDSDMKAAASRNLTPALMDRLKLDAKRIEAMAKGVADVAALPDPVGRELAR